MKQIARHLYAVLATALITQLALSGVARADATWTGLTSTDWNDVTNWSVNPSGQTVDINNATGNIATISSTSTFTPADIQVGYFSFGNSRLDQVAGSASTGSGNTLQIGGGFSDTSIYNLANTATTGGTYTGYGLGSGSMSAGNIWSGDLYGNYLPTDVAIINVNTTGTLSSANDINLGIGLQTATLNIDAGTVSTGAALRIGGDHPFNNEEGGTGYVNQSGGLVTTAGNVVLGGDVAAGGTNTVAQGSYTLAGGSLQVGDTLVVGDYGTGTFTQSGGTVSTVNNLVMASTATNSQATYTMTGGTLNVGQQFQTAFTGTGTFNQSGGAVNVNGYFVTSFTPTSNATYNLSSGTLTVATVYGNATTTGGNGTLNVSGGSMIVGSATHAAELIVDEGYTGASTGVTTISGTGSIFTYGSTMLAQDANTNATLNLNGGSLQTNEIDNGSGSGTVNFNGGTLKAKSNNNNFLSGATQANVRNGGAVIDNNGFAISIGQALLHSNINGDNARDGGLTVNGFGTTILTNNNTYTGDTTVNDGTFTLANTGNLTFVIGANGVNNEITGDGVANLGGSLTFNLASADKTLGNSWTIVDSSILGSTTFNNSFTVNGFSSNVNGDLWTMMQGGVTYQFSEDTGDLTVTDVVPEPSTYAMLLGGLACLLFWHQRRRQA